MDTGHYYILICIAETIEELEAATQPRPSTAQGGEFNMAESSQKAMLRDEFLINMSKFASSISRTIQQIEGEVKLECPDLNLSENPAENLKNEEIMHDVRARTL